MSDNQVDKNYISVSGSIDGFINQTDDSRSRFSNWQFKVTELAPALTPFRRTASMPPSRAPRIRNH